MPSGDQAGARTLLPDTIRSDLVSPCRMRRISGRRCRPGSGRTRSSRSRTRPGRSRCSCRWSRSRPVRSVSHRRRTGRRCHRRGCTRSACGPATRSGRSPRLVVGEARHGARHRIEEIELVVGLDRRARRAVAVEEDPGRGRTVTTPPVLGAGWEAGGLAGCEAVGPAGCDSAGCDPGGTDAAAIGSENSFLACLPEVPPRTDIMPPTLGRTSTCVLNVPSAPTVTVLTTASSR